MIFSAVMAVLGLALTLSGLQDGLTWRDAASAYITLFLAWRAYTLRQQDRAKLWPKKDSHGRA